MRRPLGAGQRGPRGDRRGDSSMHFYAPWLCSFGASWPVAGGSAIIAPSRSTGFVQ